MGTRMNQHLCSSRENTVGGGHRREECRPFTRRFQFNDLPISQSLSDPEATTVVVFFSLAGERAEGCARSQGRREISIGGNPQQNQVSGEER